jgi:hypothetical protein
MDFLFTENFDIVEQAESVPVSAISRNLKDRMTLSGFLPMGRISFSR